MEGRKGHSRRYNLFFSIVISLLFGALLANVAYAASPDCSKLMYVASLGRTSDGYGLMQSVSMYRLGNLIIVAAQGWDNGGIYAMEYDITTGITKDWYWILDPTGHAHTSAQPKLVMENNQLWLYVKGLSDNYVYKAQYQGPDSWSTLAQTTSTDLGTPGPTSDGYFTIYLRKNYVPILAQCYSESPLMDAMRKKGCIWNGLLQLGATPETDELISFLDRSSCVSLSRAVEDWGVSPDFGLFQTNMDTIRNKTNNRKFIYGFFIPESISSAPNTYYYADQNRFFDFSNACVPGTENEWGPNKCVPSYKNEEYRTYIRYVTRKAIDMGFQDIMFGQTYLCDNASSPFTEGEKYLSDDTSKQVLPDIISEVRQYARLKNKEIVIGGQTDPNNFRLFDYVWAGLGQQADGTLDWNTNPPYSSKYLKEGGSWSLFWRPEFASQANNMLVSFDWWGGDIDDTSMFSRMQQSDRIRVLKGYYNSFTGPGMGFQMPFLQPICWYRWGSTINTAPYTGENCSQNCRGAFPWWYDPDNKYTCKDEDVFNSLMSGNEVKTIYDRAAFVNQNAPSAMEAGKNYPVSITIRNSGNNDWTTSSYRLNVVGDNVWGKSNLELASGEDIVPDCQKSTETANLGGYAGSDPSMYRFDNGKIIIAAQGGYDNGLYAKEYDLNQGVVKDWYLASAGGYTCAQPKFVYENNSLWLYALGGSDCKTIWKIQYLGNGSWSGGYLVTGQDFGQPGPMSDGSYKVYLSRTTVDLNRNANSVILAKCAAPNNSTKTFTFNVTAPKTSGTYNFQWRMAKADGTLFGDPTLNLSIMVVTSTTTTTTTTTTTLSHTDGDADGNGRVDYDDLIILAASYGKQSGQAGFDLRADFNSDGVVDYDDLIALAANYGR